MLPNHSPWIQQLARTRPVVPLAEDIATDVVIVGGGIAGVTTVFFALRDTDRRVVLLEADKIAHGATGHNAGQITSYFERPLSELVAEFGLKMAAHGQRSVESAWELLEEICSDAGLDTPWYRFTGYAGLSNLEQVIQHLKDNRCRVEGRLPPETMVVAEEWEEVVNIPAEYRDLYTLVPQQTVLEQLETTNPDYIASLSYQKGCMNSALFVEELIGYLIAQHSDRFSFYEGSPVSTVLLRQQDAVLEVGKHFVRAQHVVLCTNGFEHFKIINHQGPDIDTSFHHSIAGRIGYMSAYVDTQWRPPTAVSYFPKNVGANVDPTGETYFYLTRRPHRTNDQQSSSLICTGGPEKVLPNGAEYRRSDTCAEDVTQHIDRFLKLNFNKYPETEDKQRFCWHGLMGYTPSGVRRVGHEPINPVLLYNLGCNGVGILPSIYGAKRISWLLNGDKLAPSIFDPQLSAQREKFA